MNRKIVINYSDGYANRDIIENGTINRFNMCLEIKNIMSHEVIFVIPYHSIKYIDYTEKEYIFINLNIEKNK